MFTVNFGAFVQFLNFLQFADGRFNGKKTAIIIQMDEFVQRTTTANTYELDVDDDCRFNSKLITNFEKC